MRSLGFAPAKVNLYLHVTGRRADGYHLLDSLAVFPAVGDVVTAAAGDAVSLAVAGPFGAVLADDPDNLVLRAARALRRGAGAGAALRLEKNLPVASGIGGGSADAAAALRVLAEFWGVDVALPEIAARLGADVPVCLGRRAAVMGGVGEVLGARMGAFSAPAALPAGWDDAAAMAADLARLRNDLEAPAMAVAPVIGEVLAALRAVPWVLLARMSGSGATCFGICQTAAAAEAAAAALARPGWWCWGGGVYEPAAGDL
jgi:4-diphosphocytidyl-2-C-methyl-D-erythritol kinase